MSAPRPDESDGRGTMVAGSITFLPDGVTHSVVPGESVLDVARRTGLYIETDCGGEGTCGKCALRVLSEAPSPTTIDQRHLTHAQLTDGWRLSCQVQPVTPAAPLTVQLVHQLQSVKAGAELMAAPLALRPRVRRVLLQVPLASLEDQRSDAARVVAALAQRRFHARPAPAVLRALPAVVRAAGGVVTATVAGGQIIHVESGDATDRCYGIAFDIGTTTVVGTLIDLTRGTELATAAMLNPQVTYGADVISRINRSLNDPDGLSRLHAAARQAVTTIAAQLAADAGISLGDVWELTFAGNTCMLHLLMGIDPRHLAPSPFVPVVTDAVSLTVGELWQNVADTPAATPSVTPPGAPSDVPQGTDARRNGLAAFTAVNGDAKGAANLPAVPAVAADAPRHLLRAEALCYVLPAVAGFVGADAVAVALATDTGERDALTLAIDIGTNGEILLGSRTRLLACSAAAGPAFEGAHIRFGTRGTPGAIEHVRFTDDGVQLDVIGRGAPRGICGSGLVDLVAELRRVGLLDETGRLLAPDDAAHVVPALGRRLRPGQSGTEFVVAYGGGGSPDITLGQRDVRELQLAKGALRAGVEVLLARLGQRVTDLDRIYLAGAFGSYISAASARAIGLIPALPLDRVESVGNAAGRGSRMALASVDARRRAEALARRIEYVELSADPSFTDAFMDAMAFPDLAELAAVDATR